MTTRDPFQESYNFDETVEDRSIRFVLKGRNYILREADADAAAKYQNKWTSCYKLGSDGKPTSVQGLADVQPYLLSLLCYEVTKDENTGKEIEKRVPLATILTWKSKVAKKLFEDAKRISDLNEETPEKITLEEILSRPDSPISLAQFREYIETVPDMDEIKDYRPFKEWFKASPEERAKNSPSAMTAGSE